MLLLSSHVSSKAQDPLMRNPGQDHYTSPLTVFSSLQKRYIGGLTSTITVIVYIIFLVPCDFQNLNSDYEELDAVSYHCMQE